VGGYQLAECISQAENYCAGQQSVEIFDLSHPDFHIDARCPFEHHQGKCIN